jgi:hypothetical protein
MPYVVPLAVFVIALGVGIRNQIDAAKRAATKAAINRFLDLGL